MTHRLKSLRNPSLRPTHGFLWNDDGPFATTPTPPEVDPVEDHPDPARSAQRSLVELIGAGDCDVAAGFYTSRAEKVRSYCAKVCRWELLERACDASFVDFVGRVRASFQPDIDLEICF